MTKTTAALRLTAVAATLMLAGASQAAEFLYEGPIRSITLIADGSGDYEVVCGVHPVRATATTRIVTPVTRPTLAQLADPTKFPMAGRSPITGQLRAGFVGGACIAEGDDLTMPGFAVARILDVDVGENVVVGAVTPSIDPANPLSINGVAIALQPDPRLTAYRVGAGFWNANGTPFVNTLGQQFIDGYRDNFGFGINITTTSLPPMGTVAAADGYYAVGNTLVTNPATGVTTEVPVKRFYAHTVLVDGLPLSRTQPRPSITRSECRNDIDPTRANDQISIDGACVLPVTGTSTTVTLAGVDANNVVVQTYGVATCTYNPAANVVTGTVNYRIGTYAFQAKNMTVAGNVCPSRIRAATTQSATVGQAPVSRYDFQYPAVR